MASWRLSYGGEALCVDRLGNHSACNGKRRGIGSESLSLPSSQNVHYLLFTAVLQHLPQDEHPSVLYGVLPELTNAFSCFLAATTPVPSPQGTPEDSSFQITDWLQLTSSLRVPLPLPRLCLNTSLHLSSHLRATSLDILSFHSNPVHHNGCC